ncbi:WD40 repeat domain-containing protein [Frankia sp. AgKG'84/4]|uniref:WD40 repeat domain-containing protein n=1 Tax=Frankia sp. AgKG'84/4 TaxID=573490 RepID=UPI00200FC30F|nr:hypothetical protein [Frankia sp. AgKG'84/4]MCL9795601.1 hypothetical protein [Frankia sp. AgKG'84/4]
MDREVATALRRQLLMLGSRRTLGRIRSPVSVFLDVATAPADASLSEMINKELARSHFFLLLASSGPDGSAERPIVAKEAEQWLALHGGRPERVLVAFTRTDEAAVAPPSAARTPPGEPRQGGEMSAARRAALTAPLGQLDDFYPAWVDLRGIYDNERLLGAMPLARRRRRAYLVRKASILAAAVRGISPELLTGWEIRRRTRVLRWTATGATVGMLLLGVLALVALQQRDEARRQTRVSESARVALKSAVVRRSDPSVANQLARAAYRLEPTREALGAVLSASGDTADIRLLGHRAVGTAVAFRPDGQLLASGSGDDTVRLWAMAAGGERPLGVIQAAAAGVAAVAFSPDGRLLLAGGAAGTTLWDVTDTRSPRLRARLPNVLGTAAAVFDPRGGAVAVGDRSAVAIWNLSRLDRPAALLTGAGALVTDLAYSADGTLLVAAAGSETRLWDTRDAFRPRRGAAARDGTGTVESISLSRDGRLLATAGFDRLVRLWDLHDRAMPVLMRRLDGPDGAVSALV